MKIHKNEKNKFLAELGYADMQYYCLDYASLDIKNRETEKLISELLAYSELDIEAQTPKVKMHVDIIKKDSHSVYILIYLDKPKRYRLRADSDKKAHTAIALNDANALISLLKVLKARGLGCDIYMSRDGKSYVVKISKRSLDKNNLKHILSEFGETLDCSPVFLAQLDEHFIQLPSA